ncbi:MAG TPA: UDP-N-acetylmuramate dehydrogenase [Spirochaetota bacterium]|nr:UDP-N-acetylmuramate dehydrogenase [Spirochaetota bacterium]
MNVTVPQDVVRRLRGLGVVKTDESLSRHTTFKTGGPADVLVVPSGVESLGEIVRICAESGLPRTVIGGGSNLLVGDRGVRGVTVCISPEALDASGPVIEDDVVYAPASVRKEDFVSICADKGLSGMEFMAGIPGCIGGGIVMNAGTVDGNFVDILYRVEYVDTAGEVRLQEIVPSMARYRHLDVQEGAIITAGWFRLRHADDGEVVRHRIRELLDERAKKHPLEYPSAGSVFKNPQGYSSWKLVNDAGLKAHRIGGAMVSELHTNFIVNAGGARSADIRGLIEFIRETVYIKFGVMLEPEVRLVGEF